MESTPNGMDNHPTLSLPAAGHAERFCCDYCVRRRTFIVIISSYRLFGLYSYKFFKFYFVDNVEADAVLTP